MLPATMRSTRSRKNCGRLLSWKNTEKMNVEQTQIRLREAKERSERFNGEQMELERELQRIAENEESIQMELETSENLEEHAI